MLNLKTFQQNSSLFACPLERVEFNFKSVNFETGSANSPLEICLNYGCIFADDSNHLSEIFCKCPEGLNPYEATALEKEYLYLNKYNRIRSKKNFWEFVVLNKSKFKPEIEAALFTCTLEKFSIYSESLSRNDFADCIFCKFASEDKVNKIIGNAFATYTLKDISEICKCPPDMTIDLYDEVYCLYRKQEPAQFLDSEKKFNRMEFQNFVSSDVIHLIKKLKNLKIGKKFSSQERQYFSRYYLNLIKTQGHQSDDEFKNIVLNWIDNKNERRLHKKNIIDLYQLNLEARIKDDYSQLVKI